MARLRNSGVTPTMQRLAILEFLESTTSHPTADEVYMAVHKSCPTIARATIYNTLEALTKAATILQLTMDPGAARYDADIAPHLHFRCRLCGTVYDVSTKKHHCLSSEVDGHEIEAVRTYAFGVCASCRGKRKSEVTASERDSRGKKPKASSDGARPPKGKGVRHAP